MIILLKDLDKRDYSVVLLETSSIKLQMYVQDKLKLKLHSTKDTIIEVSSKSDIKLVREVLGLLPPFSSRWLVIVKLNRRLGIQDLIQLIDMSTTCMFLCIVEQYKDFKQLKQSLGGIDIVELYMPYLRRADMIYLHDALVPSDNKLSKPLFDFLVQGYSSDIEEVMTLYQELNGGRKVSTKKDIMDICGLGGLTVESFIFSLLKPLNTTEKGFKKSFKNRLQAGLELSEVYNYGTFYAYMNNAISNIIQVKTLRINGTVYKSIRNLPECYNERVLSRYNRYIWKINEIPLSRMLRLYSVLVQRKWHTEIDLLNFLYSYYLRGYSDGTINLKEARKSVIS